ncbi:hypothetical protein AKJ37_00660 [candidate division MSBL1 archaeon SCGC-AAA259I09]|uniref:DNA methylase N-4/N-6 domain-containing protein n=1 Tax=candidate division MSBL1 archaeon SCGC-AAA259I09 TaxID=1698267 RepID=A0A133UVZ0_9EURY|nr:hypothetical protein AKJ37_00660 [candidate division MSBL1 archaeon SCGC-AAA259I09]
MTRQRVQQIANNFSVKEICNAFKEGKSVEEIAEVLGMTQQWVAKYDSNPTRDHKPHNKSDKLQRRCNSDDKSGDSTNQQKFEEPQQTQTEEQTQQKETKLERPTYNILGFKDGEWRKHVKDADPDQPDADFYHGVTPAFVIENLLKLYKPEKVLDSMAGIGTTGYVCEKYDIDYELYDINPYPKYNVKHPFRVTSGVSGPPLV